MNSLHKKPTVSNSERESQLTETETSFGESQHFYLKSKKKKIKNYPKEKVKNWVYKMNQIENNIKRIIPVSNPSLNQKARSNSCKRSSKNKWKKCNNKNLRPIPANLSLDPAKVSKKSDKIFDRISKRLARKSLGNIKKLKKTKVERSSYKPKINLNPEQVWKSRLHNHPLYKKLSKEVNPQEKDAVQIKFGKEVAACLSKLDNLNFIREFVNVDRSTKMKVGLVNKPKTKMISEMKSINELYYSDEENLIEKRVKGNYL